MMLQVSMHSLHIIVYWEVTGEWEESTLPSIPKTSFTNSTPEFLESFSFTGWRWVTGRKDTFCCLSVTPYRFVQYQSAFSRKTGSYLSTTALL